ncbi:MAG: hypothetical protein CMP26_05500 [Roseibacillus sp.]|nr:hypothetical protein [Roseibacillus sp.]
MWRDGDPMGAFWCALTNDFLKHGSSIPQNLQRMSNFDEHVIVRKCEQVAREQSPDPEERTLISRRSKLSDSEIDSLEIPKLQRESLTPILELVPEQALELVPERALELVPEQALELVPEQALELVPEQALGLVPEQALGLVPEQALGLVPELVLELVPEQALGLVPERALEQLRLGYSGYRERREPRGGR